MEAQNTVRSAEKGNMEVSNSILTTKRNLSLTNFAVCLSQEAARKTIAVFFFFFYVMGLRSDLKGHIWILNGLFNELQYKNFH